MALPNTLMTDTGSGTVKPTSTTTYSALRQGATGDAVKQLQTALANQGYYTGAIDGSYGPKTLAAVTAYQTANKLTVDGIAGPQTQGNLYSVQKTTTTPSTKTTTPVPVQQTGIPAVGTPLPEDIARLQGVPTTDPNAVSAAQFDKQMQDIRAAQGIKPQTGVPIGGTPLPEDIARMQGVVQKPTTTVPGAPLPEDVERRKAELAGTIPVQTIQEEQQQVKTDLDNIVSGTIGTGTGTGGTGGTRTSGATPTGGGTTTIGGTSTTGGTGTGTGTGEQSATGNWQEYFKKATETQFQYDPAQDQEYLRAASVLEQQVTDMMVGRGGLYSSVAHAALQSRLMSLQVDYQKMAYENFKEERDYNMKLAAFLADREDVQWDKDFKTMQFKASREDEEWNRSFKMAQFQADQEQRKFDNSIKTAQLRMQQANAAASRAAAQAKAQTAAKQTELAFMQVDAQARKLQLEDVVARIRESGIVDASSASFLAGDAANNIFGLEYEHPIVQSFIKGAYSYLDQEINQIAQYAKEAGDVEAYINTLSGFASQSEPVDMVSQAYAQVEAARAEGYTYKEILSAVKNDAVSYRKALGSAEYEKFVDYIESKSYSLGR